MSLYDYRAVDRAGKRIKGSIEADGARDARARLRGQGLFPIEIEVAATERVDKSSGLSWGRVSTKELASSVRQLSVLIGAGLPVVEALTAVTEQAGPTRMGRVLGEVKAEVVTGSPLAEAMAAFPKVFPEVAVNMIRSGEASGALEVVFERLADLLEGRARLAARIRAAMAYPLFMFVVGALILIFLFAYVVPTVTSIFDQTGLALPLPTRILITVAQAVREYGWLGGVALLFVALLVHRLEKSRTGRRFIDRFKLAVPVLGGVVRRLVLVRFSRTMSTLLASGVTVVDALAITAKVTGNAVYRDSLELARERIIAGATLSQQLSPPKVWPPLVSRMVAAGERSASLEAIFDRLAQGLEEEVESSLTSLLSLLEPVMILVMGGLVGFIVLSILLPIFDMTRLVG